MAVAVDATGTKKYQSANTSFSNATVITVGSGNALVVVVNFGYGGTAPASVTATWNGVSMTSLASIDRTGGGASSYVFGLRSPASGAQTLALSWSNSAEIFIDAISFTGVDVTNDGTAFPHTATQNILVAETVSVTSAVGNYVVASESPASGAATATGTQLYKDASSGSFINAMANYDVGAASVSIGTTGGNTTIIIAAVDVGAAAGGGFSPYWANKNNNGVIGAGTY